MQLEPMPQPPNAKMGPTSVGPKRNGLEGGVKAPSRPRSERMFD